jgi:hypothetical protein
MDRPRMSVNTTLPITPKKRKGGALESLLAQFGSQSSAESATKARRTSSFTSPKQDPPAVAPIPVEASKRPRPPAFTHESSWLSTNNSVDTLIALPTSETGSSEPPATPFLPPALEQDLPELSTLVTAPGPPEAPSFVQISSSEDELARAVSDIFPKSTRSHTGNVEVLKMETGRTERKPGILLRELSGRPPLSAN